MTDYSNITDNIEAIKKMAAQGDAKAQTNLAECYFYGRGVEQNYRNAVLWFENAAEQGIVPAIGNLGYCYECGLGVEIDYEKAVFWYKKAAELGNPIAQTNL